MRVVVIADIHGNVLALDAVLSDLERRGKIDLIVNLGDCVSGPLWPRETMERLEELKAVTVRGNHDRRVACDPPEEMGPVRGPERSWSWGVVDRSPCADMAR